MQKLWQKSAPRSAIGIILPHSGGVTDEDITFEWCLLNKIGY